MRAERHLTSEEVAAYLDDTLPVAERARVKEHLADCDGCRKEVVAVSRLVAAGPRTSRRLFALAGVAAAAAAVLVIVAGRIGTDRGGLSETPTRAGDNPSASEGVATIRAVTPREEKRHADNIRFIWSPDAHRGLYQFTLTNARGSRVWATTTADTSLVIPRAEASLAIGIYHWYVDVLEPDGTSATTGVATFEIVK